MRWAVVGGALAFGLSVSASELTPQRVITLSPHLAELVCAAGGCDKLVGVVAYSDFPEQVKQLPQVGDAFNVSFERITALKPDLVLAWEGGGSGQTVSRLRALGLRVESLKVQKLSEIADVIEQLGRRLGNPDVATQVAQTVRVRLDALRQRYGSARKLKVFYEIQVQPLYTINGDSPISEAIALCGGANAFAGLGLLAGTVSLEALFAADPDVVIYERQDEDSTRAFWRAHRELRAIAQGRVYPINADLLSRATPRMLDGIDELCTTLERARR